jgi:hypothetical protein
VLCTFNFFLIRAACPVQHTFLNLVTLIIFGYASVSLAALRTTHDGRTGFEQGAEYRKLAETPWENDG